jgi:hypothetical protein
MSTTTNILLDHHDVSYTALPHSPCQDDLKLWRVEYISTAVSNKLQAEVWHSPSRRGGQDAAQLFFLRCLHSERSSHRFLLFPRITVSHPLSQELLFHLVLPLYIINSLEVEGAVVCLHPNAQTTWPQLCACLVFCFLSFLHLLLPPVRFLGQAHMGHEMKLWTKINLSSLN